MLQIDCPFCGRRDETEFHCGGEAHIERPVDPAAVSDDEWADYQFNRHNSKGLHYERWQHRHGCRLWFNMARDTVSHKVLAIYPMGEQPPELSGRVIPVPLAAQQSAARLHVVEVGVSQ